MKTVIRCHVKNTERLNIAERTFRSFVDKGLTEATVIDDGSTRVKALEKLCSKYGFTYQKAGGKPSTINGLVESLKLAGPGEHVLCCTDDIVLGKNVDWVLGRIETLEVPALERLNVAWGTIGLFACYPASVRSIYPETLLWNIPWDSLYALTCHVFSPAMVAKAKQEWDGIQAGLLPWPEMCDDIWIAKLAKKHNLLCFNCLHDYAQHTGVNNRTFSDDQGSSNYISPVFVGE